MEGKLLGKEKRRRREAVYGIASRPALRVSPGCGLGEEEAELKREGRKGDRMHRKKEGRRKKREGGREEI